MRLGLYDYGARFYDPQIGRFTTQDAFAEKYINVNPYQYALNNPFKFIDINGDSIAMFKNGNYVCTVDNGKTETHGFNQQSTIDKDGKETFTGGQSFNFNDPENDAQAIRNGIITNVSFVSNGVIDNKMEESGVNDNKSFPAESYTLSQSNGKNMDYTQTSGFSKFPIEKSTLYAVKGTAYNSGDFGNFLWGQGMKRLGIPLWETRLGAHVNNIFNGRDQNAESPYDYGRGTYDSPGFLDSPGDQRAIKAGYNYNTGYQSKLLRNILKSIQK